MKRIGRKITALLMIMIIMAGQVSAMSKGDWEYIRDNREKYEGMKLDDIEIEDRNGILEKEEKARMEVTLQSYRERAKTGLFLVFLDRAQTDISTQTEAETYLKKEKEKHNLSEEYVLFLLIRSDSSETEEKGKNSGMEFFDMQKAKPVEYSGYYIAGTEAPEHISGKKIGKMLNEFVQLTKEGYSEEYALVEICSIGNDEDTRNVIIEGLVNLLLITAVIGVIVRLLFRRKKRLETTKATK